MTSVLPGGPAHRCPAAKRGEPLRAYTAIVEKCADTGLYVGYVPGFRGAHTQAKTLDELKDNLREVIETLLEDGDRQTSTEFVSTQVVLVP